MHKMLFIAVSLLRWNEFQMLDDKTLLKNDGCVSANTKQQCFREEIKRPNRTAISLGGTRMKFSNRYIQCLSHLFFFSNRQQPKKEPWKHWHKKRGKKIKINSICKLKWLFVVMCSTSFFLDERKCWQIRRSAVVMFINRKHIWMLHR